MHIYSLVSIALFYSSNRRNSFLSLTTLIPLVSNSKATHMCGHSSARELGRWPGPHRASNILYHLPNVNFLPTHTAPSYVEHLMRSLDRWFSSWKQIQRMLISSRDDSSYRESVDEILEPLICCHHCGWSPWPLAPVAWMSPLGVMHPRSILRPCCVLGSSARLRGPQVLADYSLVLLSCTPSIAPFRMAWTCKVCPSTFSLSLSFLTTTTTGTTTRGTIPSRHIMSISMQRRGTFPPCCVCLILMWQGETVPPRCFISYWT